MDKRIIIAFLLLILFQGLHSIEENIGRLWAVFPPAEYLTSLISNDHETGFLILNIGLFIFGIFCWLIVVSGATAFSKVLLIFWIIIELINGIGHPIWSLGRWAYTPGLITAPVLFILAVYLAIRLLRDKLKTEEAKAEGSE